MKKDSDRTLFLENFLPYRLSVLSNKISRGIADGYEKQFQLSLAEWRVMAILGGEPELSAGQVADRTAMDKVAVSRAVNRLIDAGRLERSFSPQDKRRSVLKLSESGQDVYAQIVPIALGYEQKILDQLSPSEQSQLDALFNKLKNIKFHT